MITDIKTLLTGASVTIERSLLPLPTSAGHEVIGTARSAPNAALIHPSTAEPVVIDADVFAAIVIASQPDVMLHQLPHLSGRIPGADRQAVNKCNAPLRCHGTATLAQAAASAGVRRVFAQSIAWGYAAQDVMLDDDPLDTGAPPPRSIKVNDEMVPLEDAIFDQHYFDGVVLRYGPLYGPGTWTQRPEGTITVHLEAEACAAFLAIHHGDTGRCDVAELNGTVFSDKAARELDWSPDFRLAGHS